MVAIDQSPILSVSLCFSLLFVYFHQHDVKVKWHGVKPAFIDGVLLCVSPVCLT